MDQAHIASLIQKYIDGIATPAEEEALLQWYRQTSIENVEWNSNNFDEELILRERMLSNIRRQRKTRVARLHSAYYAAAAILVFLTMTFLIYQQHGRDKNLSVTSLNPIRSGKDQAVLILSNGAKIGLGSDKSGVLAKQGSVVIKRTKNGQLIYDLSALKNVPGSGAIAYNTIVTPRGGQYQVVLPDGSNVWLNCQSSLKFPTAFTGHERNVQLTGEAYFEVAKNKQMPFKVNIKGTQVEVLGTHFDIMGYDGEPTVNTTLLEGSVKVSHAMQTSIIKPGQQARVGENIEVGNVDADEFIDWKNGLFSFNDEDIHSLMNRIARWYDIDVVYQGKIDNLKFTGSISKYKDFSEILKKLELTKTVNFKVEGRSITVMK